MAEGNFGRILLVVSEETNLAGSKGIIADAGNVLLVYIEVKVGITSNHSHRVVLILSGMHSRSIALKQRTGMATVVIHIEEEVIRAILRQAEEIKLEVGTIGAKDDPPSIAIENIHLYLKGEVAKVAGLRETRGEKACLGHTGVKCAVGEGTAAATILRIHFPVAAILLAQWVIQRGRAIGGRGVDIL